MKTAEDFGRGDRVIVDHGVDTDTGTVTGWIKTAHSGWLTEVELDDGGQWIGDPAWLEDVPDEPDDGELADRAYDLAIDHELGV